MSERRPRNAQTGFEAFEAGSGRRRRLLRQEQLIVQVAEKLVEMLERESVSRTELGRRLGKSKGFISQILAGDKNLTLRTVADVCDALGFRARFETSRDFGSQSHFAKTMRVSLPQAQTLRVSRVMQPQPSQVEPEHGVEAA